MKKNSEHPDTLFQSQSDRQKKRRWLTVREVADKFCVSRDTVGRWIRAGLLPAIDVSFNCRPGSHRPSWRINSENLDNFVEARANIPPAPSRAKPRHKQTDIVEFIK
jgi:excisionase family DNA binding protein